MNAYDFDDEPKKPKKRQQLSVKSFLNIAIILAVIFGFLFIAKLLYIASAQSNFNKGNYEKAAHQYLFLMSLDYKIDKYKIRYAESLMKLPFNYKNQTLIANFLEMYENKDFSYPLKEKIKRFRTNLDYKIGANYIDKVSMSNQIVRWEDDAFPLKVYINGDSYHTGIVKNAFNYWAKITKNFVSFAYVDDSSDANIVVTITGDAKTNCPNGECYYAAAMTTPDIKNNILKRMNLLLYRSDPNGRAYSDDKFYRTTLHEIGHTLGIMGHSENPEDLMYSSGQHSYSDYFAEYRSALSRQDINTLNYLYMIVPHISNVPDNKKNTINKIHPNVVLGTTNEIRRRDIQTAINYINGAPNLSVGYISLANTYTNAEMYDKALETYKKAFDLSIDKEEKYQIVYNMSITALKMHDRDLALQYAQYAQKISPTEEIAKLIHDIKYPWSLGNSRF